MLKQCSTCGEKKKLDGFYKDKTGVDGYRAKCRKCSCDSVDAVKNRERVRKYKKTKAGKICVRAYRKKRTKKTNDYINSFKNAPCVDCGVSYPSYVMDFDHLDPSKKSRNVGLMRNQSIKLIKEEIEKCEVVCANCHRERTQRRRKIRQETDFTVEKGSQ